MLCMKPKKLIFAKPSLICSIYANKRVLARDGEALEQQITSETTRLGRRQNQQENELASTSAYQTKLQI